MSDFCVFWRENNDLRESCSRGADTGDSWTVKNYLQCRSVPSNHMSLVQPEINITFTHKLQEVSCPSELIRNREAQNGGCSSQVPAVNWKEMRKHLESPRWDADTDRLAPLRPTHLVDKVIGFVWWLLVPLRPGSISPAQYVHSSNTADIRLHAQRCDYKISAVGGTESSNRWTRAFFAVFNDSRAVVVNIDHDCNLHTFNEASQQNWDPLRGHAEH